MNLDTSVATANRRARPIRPSIGSDDAYTQSTTLNRRRIYTNDDETEITRISTGTRDSSEPNIAEARCVAQLDSQAAVNRVNATPLTIANQPLHLQIPTIQYVGENVVAVTCQR